MRVRSLLLSLAALALAAPGTSAAPEGRAARNSAARPHLELRAVPSTAFSPATVMVVGRLVGGDDLEEFYCPGLDWDWGDGSRSVREGDCPPYEDGTRMARFFSLRYRYRAAGNFKIRLTLRRAGRAVASATVSVRVLGRGGEAGMPVLGSAVR